MAYTRKDYAGGAAETTISGSITAADTTISIASATGWPSGTNGAYVVVIDEGTASEEKVLIASRTSTSLSVSARGYDGTTAAAHSSGASIAHCLSAVDFDEANYAVTQTVGKVTTAGDLLVGSGANALVRLAKGSNSTLLGVDAGGTLGYTTVTSAMITDGTIDGADFKDNSVTASKIATSVAGDGLTGGGGSALAVNPGTGLEISSDTVRIAAAAAGDGLTGGAGSALAVNTGTSSATGLEISSDTVRIAAGAAGAGLTGGAGSALAVGAGTGITVNADDVAINTSVITTGAWSTWTPVIKQNSATVTHTAEVASYHRTGRMIHAHLTAKVTANVTGGNTAAPHFTLPVNPATLPSMGLRFIGTGMIKASGTWYVCHVRLDSGVPNEAYIEGIATNLSTMSPASGAYNITTWGDWAAALKSNDYIDADFVYEAAS